MNDLIHTWSPLFALDKTGKLRTYTQELDGLNLKTVDAYDAYVLKSKTGLLKGAQKQNVTKITKAARGNTILDQAYVVARKAYNDKLNEGYKTKEMLLSYGLAQGYDEAEIAELTAEQLYKKLKIKYNTDTRWYPLPMLADKYESKKKKVVFPGIVQPKLNGVRCLALWDKDKNELVLVSRGGQSYYIPHLEKQLKPFFQTHPDVILDGEIFCHGKRLQTISGAARKEKDAPDWLEYHVYDVVSDDSQTQRVLDYSAHVLAIRGQWKGESIYQVPSYFVKSHEEIKQYHDDFVASGYEGAMYRNPNARYGVSFRVDDLLKIKEFIDEEFEIVGCKTDDSKTIEESFVFILQNNTNDLYFNARPTGSGEEKRFWHDNIAAFTGFKATVRYQERTADGLPHQGHVRADKTECLTIEEVDPLK
jgi:ATP-dependent DNA ligase